MLKPQTSSVTGASSLVNLSTNTNLSTSLSKSSENITTCEFDVPKSNAPPIPKHNVVKTADVIENIDDNLKRVNFSSTSDTCEKVIVGPAETITGIIDTRPLEARKPIITNSNTSSSCSNIDGKESAIVSPNGANNLYHLKVSSNHPQQQQQLLQQQQNQLRHQSYPNHFTTQSSAGNQFVTSAPSKSQTTPHLGLEYVKLCTTSTTTNAATSPNASASPNEHSTDHGLASNNNATTNNGTSNNLNSVTINSNCSNRSTNNSAPTPLLYENITLNTKDCNVPYENINLEYIARLMNEGYSKNDVITALGISRNNIEMACDILHEFVSKSGA